MFLWGLIVPAPLLEWIMETFANPWVFIPLILFGILLVAYIAGFGKKAGSITAEAVLPTPTPEKQEPTEVRQRSTIRQIARPPEPFVGRGTELRQLMKAVGGQNVSISGLRGMGGVGKTALAQRLAWELSSQYPGAHLYVDLQGTSDPLTPARAMEKVIVSFEPDYKAAEDVDQVRGKYLGLLDGERAILLMDNAADAAQVAPLKPPKGSLLIVTSRQDFNIGGWFALDLDVLPEKEAKELLLKLCPRIDKDAGEIAELCGYLPLALRLVGGALAARETLSVEDYVSGLRDEKTRVATLDKYKDVTDAEKTIEASFLQSYELLSDDLKKAWRELAVFPLDFHSNSAGALWQVEDKVARERLGNLAACHLLDWDRETTRYRLHDLARDFAASRLGEDTEEEYAAGKRHAAHFLEVLRVANDLYLEGHEKVVVGLALFDIERANIERGFAWASARIETDDEAAAMTNDYPNAGAYCLDLRQHPRTERIPWLKKALEAAGKLDDKKAEGNHMGNLGNAYADLGETQKAIEYYEKALRIAREIGDRRGEGHSLGNLGLAYTKLGNVEKAFEYLEEDLVLARQIGDRRAEGNALGNLGSAYLQRSQREKAIEYYEKTIVIFREIGDRRGEGTALWNKALALDTLARRGEAIKCAEEALAIFEAIEDPGAAKVRAALAEWRGE